MHVYEIRPRNDKRGVDLISDVLPFGRFWYDGQLRKGLCKIIGDDLSTLHIRTAELIRGLSVPFPL